MMERLRNGPCDGECEQCQKKAEEEYEELCRLHGCVPVPTDGIPPYETEFAIGYRRGIGYH